MNHPAQTARDGQSARFPAPGNDYEARFGDMAFRLNFHADGRTMTFLGLPGSALAGVTETIQYTAVPLGGSLFMVHWKEANGTTVTHVEDFDAGVVHTNITTPALEFINLSGTLRPLR